MNNELIKSSVYRTETGAVVTDSLKVAQVFDKRHPDVLRAIRNTLTQNCTDLDQWFQETTYADEQGKLNPMYLMTRDGFSLLAMGFTGPKATQFKVGIIQQFNSMERMINDPAFLVQRLLNDPDMAINMLTAYKQQQKVLEQQARTIEQEQKFVILGKAVKDSSKDISVKELALLITQSGHKIGRNELFDWLRDNGWVCKTRKDWNLPTQKAIDHGVLKIKREPFNYPNGDVGYSSTTVVTPKGQLYFVNQFSKEQPTND